MTISLDMSLKKLVKLVAQTLRGSERRPLPGALVSFSLVIVSVFLP
jgi:hypothetical protein